MFGPQTAPQTAANPIVINLPSTDPSHEKEKIRKSFPKRAMMLLSILQIICGCLAVLFQVNIYHTGSIRVRSQIQYRSLIESAPIT